MGKDWITGDTLPLPLTHHHKPTLLSLPFPPHASSSKATLRGASLDVQEAGCWLAPVRRHLLYINIKYLNIKSRLNMKDPPSTLRITNA